MHNFIIYFPKMSGGAGTLSIRIFSSLSKNLYRSYYLYETENDENNKNHLEDLGVQLIKISTIDELMSNFEKFCFEDVELFVLTYTFTEFCKIQRIKELLKCKNLKIILYVIHPSTLIFGYSLKAKVYRYFLRRTITTYLENKQILFMDKECLDKTLFAYKERRTYIDNILLLPMVINKDLNNVVKKHIGDSRQIVILTIFRSEFPFKGYIFGLIETFADLAKKYPFLYLKIITYGSQQKDVLEKINSLSEDISRNINFIGRVPYTQLKDYFLDTDLFVGMGTTVLDAANFFIPALVVKAYTYECITSGYFSDNPFEIAADGDNLSTISEYIEDFIQKDGNDRLHLRKISYTKLCNNYDIKNFLLKIFLILNSYKMINISPFEKLLRNFYLLYMKR